MKKNIFLIVFLFSFSPNYIQAQDTKPAKSNLILEADAATSISPNGNTYGLLLSIEKPFRMNNKGNISMNFGIQEDFTVGLERGFEGTYGTTVKNGVHILVGPSIYIFPARRLVFKPQLYCGWSYKTTSMGIDNAELNINRTYHDSYHYLSRGVFLRAGYSVKKDVSITAFFKADLRRLTDGDGILEYPFMLYGVGITKLF